MAEVSYLSVNNGARQRRFFGEKMRKLTRFGVLFGAGLAFGVSLPAKAALVTYYDFNAQPLGALAEGTTILNKAGGANGIFHVGSDVGGSGTVVTSTAGAGFGNAITFTPSTDVSANGGAPNIDTTLTAAALGVTPGTAYTAMAWVNFASTAGDNMIFGQDNSVAANGSVLHHGTRNGQLHSGHWGDDIGPDQAVNVPPGTGSWHHVAYTNDGAAGNQSIYLDGVLVVGPGATGTGGGMDVNQNLLIATSGNGGSFSGMLDEVKIYNTELSAGEIQAASQVPEPTTMAAVVLGGAALFMGRRRRADH